MRTHDHPTLGLIRGDLDRPTDDPLAPPAIAGALGVPVAEVRGALIELARLGLPLRPNEHGPDAA